MPTLAHARARRILGMSLVLAVAAVAAVATQASASSRFVLANSKEPWTSAAQPAAAMAPQTLGTTAMVWLAPRNAAGLDALAQAISDPNSAQYRHFISEPQYRAQYAPTGAQVAQVTQWLASAGLTVTDTGPDNHYVTATGSAAAVNSAFGTQLQTYVVNGTPQSAPATDLSVPDSVQSLVLGVTGLSSFGNQVRPADFGAPAAFVPGRPCSDFYGQKTATGLPKPFGHALPYTICGYTATQLRGAYGVTQSRRSGAGATVAITDAFDASTLLADANQTAVRHGDRPFAAGQFQDRSVPEDPAFEDECGGNGWYGEEALDIEAVHGMAPAANVLYYGGSNCGDSGLLGSLTRVVADNKASIVTNSWGDVTFQLVDGQKVQTLDAATVKAYESVFKQGAVQGIGFYFSSGDDGDDLAADGVKQVEYPTSDPWVTSVGGTSIAIGKQNQRLWETGWGTRSAQLSDDGKSFGPFSDHGGAGGGFSEFFGKPWWQIGTPGRTRAVPDVGMESDPTTGMLVGETQDFDLPSMYGPPGVHYGEYRIGGTSLGSPLFAGAQAVAEGGRRIGFADPLIYGLARLRAFNDIVPTGDPANVRVDFANGENADDGLITYLRTFDQDTSLFTAPGWDDVTGNGSVSALYLFEAAAALRF
jgi:subtilase family serine protease